MGPVGDPISVSITVKRVIANNITNAAELPRHERVSEPTNIAEKINLQTHLEPSKQQLVLPCNPVVGLESIFGL